MSTGTVVLLVPATVLLGVLGILIKHYGMVSLVAGYDPDTVEDPEGLAAFIGTNTLYAVVLTGTVAVFEYTRPFAGYRLVWALFFIGLLLLTGRMVRGARRYEAAP